MNAKDFLPTDFELHRGRVLSYGRLLLCALSLAVMGCGGGQSASAVADAPAIRPQPKVTSEPSQLADDENTPLLTDVTEQLGFKIPKEPWPDGTHKTPEVIPGGIALFDYDNDGRLDILQICHSPPGALDKPTPNRLFHQEPDGTFKEVPNAGGLTGTDYGYGVAVGDVDNDGYPDVFISSFGGDRFFHNNGDGTFTDKTVEAGFDPKAYHWSSSCAFVDYDRDGYLDLFVTRFAEFDPKQICQGSADSQDVDYCGPHIFKSVLSTLYHNNGDGTFTDVTAKAGIDAPSRGWGVVCADFTGDGWPDIYVANDEEPAQLWVNQRDGTFKEEAIERGCALNAAGHVEAGMGIAVGDVNGDGNLDLLVTHISTEADVLYLSLPKPGRFVDRTIQSGMGPVLRPYTRWGCGFLDIYNRGILDFAVCCGRIYSSTVQPGAAPANFGIGMRSPNFCF